MTKCIYFDTKLPYMNWYVLNAKFYHKSKQNCGVKIIKICEFFWSKISKLWNKAFSRNLNLILKKTLAYFDLNFSKILPNHLTFFWLMVWTHNFKESTPKVYQLLSQNMFCLVSSFDIDFGIYIINFNMLSISIWSNFHFHS